MGSVLFDEAQVRAHLDLLSHDGWGVTEVTLIPDRGYLLTGFFNDWGRLVEAVQPWSGRQNVYIGVQPRRVELLDLAPNELRPLGRRGRDEDAVHLTALFLDIDVVTDERKRVGGFGLSAASTKAEVKIAIKAARAIRHREPLLADAVISCSGNGAHLTVPIDLPGSDEMAGRLATYGAEVQKKYETRLRKYGLVLDSTFDRARVMTLAGTLKIKGDPLVHPDRPHRLAHFLDGPPRRVVNSALNDYISELPAIITNRGAQDSLSLGTERFIPDDELVAPHQLCEAWARIFCEVERVQNAAGKLVRHKVLFLLAAALRHVGYDFDSIVTAIALHDQHLGQKFRDEGTDPARFVRHVLAAGDRIGPTYLCKIGSDILGTTACCDECEQRADEPRIGSTRCRSVPALKRRTVVESLSVEEARGDLEGAVFDFLRVVIARKSRGDP